MIDSLLSSVSSDLCILCSIRSVYYENAAKTASLTVEEDTEICWRHLLTF